jgi:hypothetical protein
VNKKKNDENGNKTPLMNNKITKFGNRKQLLQKLKALQEIKKQTNTIFNI